MLGQALRDLFHRLERVDLVDRLVRPQADDPRKAHRVAGVVSIALLDLVERDLDDRVWTDDPDLTEILDGRREEVLGHLGDLLVGETGVRLSYVAQTVAVADCERVV